MKTLLMGNSTAKHKFKNRIRSTLCDLTMAFELYLKKKMKKLEHKLGNDKLYILSCVCF